MTELREDEKREQQRRRQIENSKQEGWSLCQKTIDFKPLQISSDAQADFNQQWTNFTEKLKAKKNLRNHRYYAEAYNYCLTQLQEKIEDKDLALSFPSYIIIDKRTPTFRTRQWFLLGKIWFSLYRQWMNRFENVKNIEIQDILLSLVLHNGIVHQKILQKILDQLVEDKLPIYQYFDLPFIYLTFNESEFATNIHENGKYLTQFNLFLSPITATLLQKWQANTDGNLLKTQGNRVNDLMQKTFEKFGLSYTGSLQNMLNTAIYVMENHHGFEVSELMLSLLQHKIYSYSLPLSNWQVILYERNFAKFDTTVEQRALQKTSQISPNKSQTKILTSKISKLFRFDTGKRISEKRFTEELNQLLVWLKKNDAPTNEISIISWLKSKQSTCQPNTLRTYSNTITNRWLERSFGTDIESYDEEDFELLYTEIINASRTDKAKNQTAIILDEFHRYLVGNFGVVSIGRLSNTQKPHHKTAYLSHTMMQALFNAVEISSLSKNEKDNLKVVLILGSRLGMRIGEINKLRIKDFSLEIDYLEVRENKYAKNKSDSALRRLLIKLLLTPEELAFINAILETRKAKKYDTLIADSGGHPLLKNTISTQISLLMKQVTGLEYLTTHSLRHTCLNNLQLLSFLYDEDYAHFAGTTIDSLKSLLPYDKMQGKHIICILESQQTYQKYFILAGFAGHASPETSFESYIHFTDIQFGVLFWQIDYHLSKAQAKNLIDLPRRENHDGSQQINDYLLKKILSKAKNLPKYRGKQLQTSKIQSTRQYSFDEVHILVESYLSNDDFESKCYRYQVDISVIEDWLQRAKLLKTDKRFLTQKKHSKFFNPIDQSLTLNHKLSKRESHWVIHILNQFRKLWKEEIHRTNLAFFVLQNLMAYQDNPHRISFKNLVECEQYMCAVKWLKINEILYATLTNAQKKSDAIALWQKACKPLQNNHILIEYLSKNSYKKLMTTTLTVKMSTNENASFLLTYVSHYIYILMGDKIENCLIEQENIPCYDDGNLY